MTGLDLALEPSSRGVSCVLTFEVDLSNPDRITIEIPIGVDLLSNPQGCLRSLRAFLSRQKKLGWNNTTWKGNLRRDEMDIARREVQLANFKQGILFIKHVGKLDMN
ncbi:hypothetical protein HAX54_041012 [Datura stramonium]|uniref:Uncharacterized protein n=1 Tax=Datura stramonium TaxID=4076 RepID=A0ABS8SL57_DATST|nr:hypothetical protein [Datura stramonium]